MEAVVSGKWHVSGVSTVGFLPNDRIFLKLYFLFFIYIYILYYFSFSNGKEGNAHVLKSRIQCEYKSHIVHESILDWQSVLSFLQKLHIFHALL